ncbi:MAG: hypothetical protein IPP78_02755 [Holophagaceae bacterium]|nr:hypothetical protein [Holophagaceae bacterium]
MRTSPIRNRLIIAGAALLFLGGGVAWWRISRQVRQAFDTPTRNLQALQFAPLAMPSMQVEHWGGGEVSALGLSPDGLITAGAFGVFDGNGDITAGLPTLHVSALALWRGRAVVGLAAGGLFLRRDKAWEEARTGFGTLHVRDLRETPGGELLIGAREGLFRAAWGANVVERLDGTPVRSIAAGSGGTLFAGGEQGLKRLGGMQALAVPTTDPWVDGIATLGKELVVLTPKGLARGPLEGPLLPVSGAEDASAFAVLGAQVFAVSEGRLLRFEASGRPSEELLSSKVIKVFASEGVLFADTESGLFQRMSSGWTLARPRPASLPPGPCHVNALARQGERLVVGLFNGGLAIGATSGNTWMWSAVPGSVAWGVNALLNAGGTLHVASLRGFARLEGGMLRPIEPLDAGAAFSLASTREGVVVGFGQGVLLPGSRLLSAFHGLPGNQALALVQGPEESDPLFVGTPSGLGAISGSRVAWRTLAGDGKLPHPWVTALAYHGADLYVGTYGGGIVRRITSHSGPAGPGSFEAFPETAGLKVNTGCLVEAGGRLYMGTDGRGLWRLSADRSHFAPVRVPLSSSHVTAILAGKDALFVGTDEGLVRLPLSLPEEIN